MEFGAGGDFPNRRSQNYHARTPDHRVLRSMGPVGRTQERVLVDAILLVVHPALKYGDSLILYNIVAPQVRVY